MSPNRPVFEAGLLAYGGGRRWHERSGLAFIAPSRLRSGCATNDTVYSCGGSCGIDHIPFLAPILISCGSANLERARLRSAQAKVNEQTECDAACHACSPQSTPDFWPRAIASVFKSIPPKGDPSDPQKAKPHAPTGLVEDRNPHHDNPDLEVEVEVELELKLKLKPLLLIFYQDSTDTEKRDLGAG